MNSFHRNLLAALTVATAASGLLAGSLPPGYTALEYVETNGKQFVDTGLRSAGNIHIETEFQLTDITIIKKRGDSNTLLGSCKTTDGKGREAVRPIRFNMNWLVASIGDSMAHFDWSVEDAAKAKTKLTVNLDANGFIQDPWLKPQKYVLINGKSINGRSWLSGNVGVIPPTGFDRHLYLFACNENGKANYMCFAKLWSMKIWKRSMKGSMATPTVTDLIFDVIPCKRDSDGMVGLWECVSGKFLCSGSADPLVAGPAK